MTNEELQEFGVVTNRLESALRTAHDAMRNSDQIEIVYLVRLGESTRARPAEWHLHYHMVPRTSSMRQRCEGWDIQKCRERGVRPAPSEREIEELMAGIRHQLDVSN
jgi:diadenosine tetraphosphate (Ap4A) HIT family hydrolase